MKHRIDEQREAQKMQAEALQMQSEKLAARNQQARQVREVQMGLAPGNAVARLLIMLSAHPSW